MPPSSPLDAPERLAALRRSGLLDSPCTPSFNRLTRLACRALGTPVAVVSLLDRERQLFLSCRGLPEAPAPLADPFFRHVVESGEIQLVEDAREHPGLRDTAWVTEFGVGACAGAPLRTDDGHVLGSLSVFDFEPRRWTREEVEALTDLAEGARSEIEMRRQARERREGWERYSALLQETGQGVWETDLITGECRHWSSWLALIGYAPGDIEPHLGEWEALIHPEDLADVHAMLEAHLTGRLPVYEVEYRMRTRGGEWRWFLSRGRVIERDASGAALRIAGTILDLTVRKHMEQVLLRSQEQTTAILESITDGFLAVDREWRFTYVNREALRFTRELLQADRDSVLGHDLWEVMPGVVGTDFERAYRRAMEERVPTHVEACFAGHWFEERVYPSAEGISIYFRDVTDRRLAEAALQESEARFRQMAASINDVFWLFDVPTDRLVYVSPGYERLWGRPLESLGPSPRMTLQAVFEEDRPAFWSALSAALEGREGEVEYRILRPDGEVRWGRSRLFRVAGGEGEVHRIAGITTDVTAEKTAREALETRERYFRHLIENSSDLTTVLDAAGTVVYESPSVDRVVGWMPGETLGTSVFALIHPDDVARVQEVFRAGVADPSLRLAASYRLRDRDGNWREIESTGTNLLADPAVRAVVVNSRDVTERNAAEETIRFKAELLHAVGQAVVATDLQRSILYVNRAWERLYGWSREEVLGRNLLEVVRAARDWKEHPEVLERLRAGEVLSADFQVESRDGRSFPVNVTNSPIFGPNGELEAVIAISSDLTQRKQLEEQLRQAQKMEAVGRLAGGIAHDFNNLLTVMKGYAHMLSAELGDRPELLGEVEVIVGAVDRGSALTHQLLSFSRKQVLQPKVVSFNRVIEELEKLLRRTIGEDVELQLELDPRLHPILADPGQMEQIVMNLAVNARDAMPRGGRLTLRTWNVPAEQALTTRFGAVPRGDYIGIEVSDSGQGMDAAILPQIFEPFFTTKGPGKGTGLGLATVYGIVQQSGGYLDVESESGRGAAFRIYLPRAPVLKAPDRPSPAAPATAPPGGTETILLVEDDPFVRELVRSILSRKGYTLLEAGNPDEALALRRLYRGELHLLLADVVMPGGSGRELAEQLEARGARPRVLYMSGYTDDAVLRHGIQAGHPFLQKPFSPEQLLRKVRDVLDPSSG